MKGCYYVCKNYGIALLLFTFITRIIVFPLNVKQQKSSARMSMIKPKLDELQKKYAKDQNKLQEEQMKLYAEANVNPMASCLPMIITMVILFALIPVIYGPLTYVSSGIDKDDITRNNNLISNLAVVSQEVQSNETTVAALLEEHADAEDPYEELKTLFTDEEQYPNSAKQLSKNGGVDDVIAAIKLHNDIDTFITDDSYFSQNLIKSRPELMTFVFCQDAGGKYSDVMYIVDDRIGDFATDFNYSIFGIYMGTYYGWAKMYDRRGMNGRRNYELFKALAVPTLLHGIYDYSLTIDSEYAFYGFLIYIIVLDVMAIKHIRRSASLDESITSASDREVGIRPAAGEQKIESLADLKDALDHQKKDEDPFSRK